MTKNHEDDCLVLTATEQWNYYACMDARKIMSLLSVLGGVAAACVTAAVAVSDKTISTWWAPVAGLVGAAVTLILLLAIQAVWYFILDRIREVAVAIRGE